MAAAIRGRVAIVTGASSGIGRAVALDLAARGATVIACARRGPLLEEVAAACRRTAPESEAAVLDVADRGAVEALVNRILERHGRVDVLVNNAGISMRVHATRLTVEDVERVMAVNFMGAVTATLAVLPSMLRRRAGRIVNVASVAGRIPSPRESAYTASKHALVGFTDALAADLQGTGVGVHLVIPGPIATGIWETTAEPPAYRGKLYPPRDVARAVRACLERGSYERWVPRRLRLLPFVRALAPRTLISGTARYDRRGMLARRRSG